jgi:hypothetical protein
MFGGSPGLSLPLLQRLAMLLVSSPLDDRLEHTADAKDRQNRDEDRDRDFHTPPSHLIPHGTGRTLPGSVVSKRRG